MHDWLQSQAKQHNSGERRLKIENSTHKLGDSRLLIATFMHYKRTWMNLGLYMVLTMSAMTLVACKTSISGIEKSKKKYYSG
jgi:hypothetical protein